MVNVTDIPVWTLVVLNVVTAGGFWMLCSNLLQSGPGRIRAAVALGVAYTGIGLRATVSAGSARVSLIIATEALLVLMLGVLPFVGYLKTEISAQKSGEAVDQSRSNTMALWFVGAVLGLLAVFFLVDGLLIRDFFSTR